MNALRSSPLSDLALASALQVFIFSCWVAALALPPAFRQLLMNALRSSPLSALVVASALQAVIFSCCAVAAKPWAETAMANTNIGIRRIFIELSLKGCTFACRCAEV